MTRSIAGRFVAVAMVGALSSGTAFAGSHEGEPPAPEGSGGREAAPSPAESGGGAQAPEAEADDAAPEKKPPPPSKREGS